MGAIIDAINNAMENNPIFNICCPFFDHMAGFYVSPFTSQPQCYDTLTVCLQSHVIWIIWSYHLPHKEGSLQMLLIRGTMVNSGKQLNLQSMEGPILTPRINWQTKGRLCAIYGQGWTIGNSANTIKY